MNTASRISRNWEQTMYKSAAILGIASASVLLGLPAASGNLQSTGQYEPNDSPTIPSQLQNGGLLIAASSHKS